MKTIPEKRVRMSGFTLIELLVVISIIALLMAGHVRKVGLKELWTLKWGPNSDAAGRWTLAGGVKPNDWPEWMRGFKDY